ncbi:hypothetical protein TNCV_3664031 [Trichonephila clavipes]|nr:hypothetical protein TNCV_3664031 [Trichonephila clavipes]
MVYENLIECRENLVAILSVAAGNVRDIPGIFDNEHQSMHHCCESCVSVGDRSFDHILIATAGSDIVQSGRPIFDDFFQHLWPYIGNNKANVVFQMVKRLWLIRIDQGWRTSGTRAIDGTRRNILGTPPI